jgi:methylenetetrahydrofolate dehydrogenase (NADP+)/methenyltetrahydrofolate cyclohydrolase
MPAKILDGRALAAESRAELVTRTAALAARGVAPHLMVAVVGEDPSSQAYIRGLEKLAAQIGIAVTIDRLPESIDVRNLRAALERYGRDESIHGVLLQQPLPAHLPIRSIADAIPAAKDVDGANPGNLGLLAFAEAARLVPATPAAVMLLLEKSAKWPLRGREVAVIGRSSVIGLPVSLLLIAQSATVTVVHRGTRDVREHTRRAEIVIAAAGTPKLVDGSWLSPGATVIDVGTTVVDGKLTGDVEFASASEVAGEITPVPGGVGPLTNVMLMRNVLVAAETQPSEWMI